MDRDLQVRMDDTYEKVEFLIAQIRKLQVDSPLDWIFTWDIALSTYREFQLDPEFIINRNIIEVWELFYSQFEESGFGLSSGREILSETVRKWMIDRDIVSKGVIEEDYDDD